MTVLAAHHVTLSRESRTLLEEVSIEVRPGEVHALLGPNGAGKSTLLRLLAGDLPPDHGRVELDGRALADWPLPELARRRAVLPQQESLRFAFTAAEVVSLGRLPWGDRQSPVHGRIVEESLTLAGVAALARRRYPSLSGGERARVQFARVLAQLVDPTPGNSQARYLLLDEPTASLDLAHQYHCLEQIRRVAAGGGGVLAILHDPNQALAYADRVTLLKAGRRVAQGEPQDVLTAERLSHLYDFELRLHSSATGHTIIAPANGRIPGRLGPGQSIQERSTR